MKRRLLLILLVILVAGAGIITNIVLTHQSSKEETVREFLTKIYTVSDYNSYDGLTSAGPEKKIDKLKEEYSGFFTAEGLQDILLNQRIPTIVQSGVLNLIKENGEWKIDNLRLY